MARLTKEEQEFLVAAARIGDEAAITRLYNGITPMIRRALRRMVSENDIDDVVQGAMTKAITRIHQYRDEASFSTWCVQIAKNDGLMQRRKDKRRGEIVVDSIDNTLTPDGQTKKAIDVGYEDRGVERNLAYATVHGAITQLPSVQARALRMKLDGFSNEEIANVLGETVANTKSIIHRGRAALKTLIKGRKGVPGTRGCRCGCGGAVRGCGYIKGHRKLARAA